MTRSTDEQSLIEELNERQNDVLDRLAELNGRVESLLNECLAGRDAKQPTMEQSGRVGEKA